MTETWGKEWISDGIFNLIGFNMYRNDRGVTRGGGTILYVSDKIEQRVCRPLNESNFDSSVWCWINEKGGKKILVGSVYRSPNSTTENDKKLMDMITRANDMTGDNRLLMMGDFNVLKIDWKTKSLTQGAGRIDEWMLDVTNDCFLHQHVMEHTRYCKKESSTLDLIFTNEEEDVKDIEILPPLVGSDHGVVMGNFVSQWISRTVQKPWKMYQKVSMIKLMRV